MTNGVTIADDGSVSKTIGGVTWRAVRGEACTICMVDVTSAQLREIAPAIDFLKRTRGAEIQTSTNPDDVEPGFDIYVWMRIPDAK